MLLQILVLILVVATVIEAAMQIAGYLDGIIHAHRLLLAGGLFAATIPAACAIFWSGRAIFAPGDRAARMLRRWLARHRKDPA